MIRMWFTFSKGEKLGVILLVAVLAGVTLCPRWISSLFTSADTSFDRTKRELVDSFFNALEAPISTQRGKFSLTGEERFRNAEPEFFSFDPNTATIADFQRMGFTSKQAQVIERFRQRGGKFKVARDFARVYVVDSIMFAKLEPYISIPPPSHPWQLQANLYDSLHRTREQLVIELNTADTLELTKLKGIGRVFAQRIVNFRTLLGGFMAVEQLNDIYGFTPEMVERISPHVRVDTLRAQRMSLNLVSYDELRRHPYLNSYQARAIIYYRDKQGTFRRIDELVENKLLDAKTYEKIRPYFVLN